MTTACQTPGPIDRGPPKLCEDRPMRPAVALPLSCVVACTAFVAAAVMAAPPQPLVVQGLDCRADDGTWRVEASRTSAQYSATAPRKRDVVFRGGLQALGPTGAIVVWRGDTTHLPKETIVLAAREDACRMALPGIPSGTHVALLSIRAGEAATGCCVVRAGYDLRAAPVANLAARPAGEWTRQAVELAPALAACAAKQGASFRAVTAAQTQGDTVRLRLRDIDGKDALCTVDAKGRGAALAPAPADLPAAGAWWYPAREPSPIIACGRVERVQNARGGVIGYVQYDPC